MSEPESAPVRRLSLRPEFHRLLGLFHTVFASLDVITDFAIGKFLKTTPKEAHLITAGMVYGRKARLLADLIGRSDHSNKDAILGAFNAVRGDHKRDIIAHGYIWSDAEFVCFIEKNTSNEFKATEHAFTLQTFRDHLAGFVKKVDAFFNSLGCTREELDAFGGAVFSLNRKSKTSPGKPTSSK